MAQQDAETGKMAEEGAVITGEITEEKAKKNIRLLAEPLVDIRPNKAHMDSENLRFYCRVASDIKKQLNCSGYCHDNL